MTIATVASGDTISSDLWNSLAGLLNGTTGEGGPIFAYQHNSASVYSATFGNIDTTNGLIAKFQYGPVLTATTAATITKAGLAVNAILPVSGTTLSLASSPGETVSIAQNDWTEAQVFGLQVAKYVHAPSSGLLTSSATAQFLQTLRDDHPTGADDVIVQVFGGSSGAHRTSFRSFEAIAGRYAATSGNTSYSTYGAVNPATMDIGSTRAITANLFVEAAITAAYTQAIDAIGVLAYSGAQDAAIDGRAIASVRSGVVAFGALAGGASRTTQGGWDYLFLGDADPFGVLAGPPATRYAHLRTTGGTDMLYLASGDTVGTGLRLTNTSAGAIRDIFVAGSGAAYPGGLAFYNPTDVRYMAVIKKSAVTTTVDQLLLGDGAAATPVLSNLTDIDTGATWALGGANTFSLVTGGTEALRVTSAQLLDFRVGTVALGGGAAPTVGTIGGSGPATAAQNSWLKILVGGVASYIPIWR